MRLRSLALGACCMVACLGEAPADGVIPGTGAPGRLYVTTTDFSTGALTVADVETRVFELDVALTSTDAIPHAHDGLIYVVNRFGIDRVDVRDPDQGYGLVGQFPIEAGSAGPANPHALAFAGDGRAFLTLYGAPEIREYDFRLAADDALIRSIDLSSLADGDGTTETYLAHVHEGELFAAVQRLDQRQNFLKVDEDLCVVIDVSTGEITDETVLPGRWPRQWRSVPDDPGALMLLSSGLVSIDLETREARWWVSDERFADVGITSHLGPLAFDFGPEGAEVYVAAATDDFTEVRVFRVREGETPEPVIDGLNAVERTLEIVGEELWFGDTTIGSAGLRAFDLGVDPPMPLSEDPVQTGLPPYSMIAIE